MEGERIVFTHEVEPEHSVRIVESGAVDEALIDAVSMFFGVAKEATRPDHQEAQGMKPSLVTASY
jgi:hypothetical protein